MRYQVRFKYRGRDYGTGNNFNNLKLALVECRAEQSADNHANYYVLDIETQKIYR